MNKNSNPERGVFLIPSNDYKKNNETRGASITRDPVIPLMEEEKSKAINRELVVDFNNRIIKAKDPNTGEFVNLSNTVIEQVFNDQGIKLQVLDDVIPTPTSITSDFKSIDIKDGIITIHGFSDEYNMKVPAAVHGEVIWKDVNELTTMSGNAGGVESAEAGNNNLLVLGVKKAQVTDNFPTSDFKLIIPSDEVLGDYMRIVWKVTTDDNYIINFPENTHFECSPFIYDQNTVFDPHTIYIVELQTFDRGDSWFCSCRGFSK